MERQKEANCPQLKEFEGTGQENAMCGLELHPEIRA